VAGGGAEFFYCPAVSQDCSRLFLEQIAARDPQAVHTVIWDGAGFHQGESSQDLPGNIRILSLPAYSPELNPVEKLWDIVRDRICNRLFADLTELEATITCVLKDYWLDAGRVLNLVGRNRLPAQANAFSANIIPM
jgi:transposase